MSAIEWTDQTWNPVVGCSPVSEGCRNCFAARDAIRLAGNPHPAIGPLYEGTAEMRGVGNIRRPVFTGTVRAVPERLEEPLRWRKPRRVFVNSMSDLFHGAVSFDFLDQVFAVMALAGNHTFQILTKRPERMAEYLTEPHGGMRARQRIGLAVLELLLESPNAMRAAGHHPPVMATADDGFEGALATWPLPNVWLGTSVEDQAAADARIPPLLEIPAAVRFLSCEPLLGPVDIRHRLEARTSLHMGVSVEGAIRNRAFDGFQRDDGTPMSRQEAETELWNLMRQGVRVIPASSDCDSFDPQAGCPGHRRPGIDWVIVGGESGPGARPCNVEWIRSLVEQCQRAAVPAFVKQLGAVVLDRNDVGFGDDGGPHSWPVDHDVEEWGPWHQGSSARVRLGDRKGGDPSEWPQDLRVREFPAGGGFQP